MIKEEYFVDNTFKVILGLKKEHKIWFCRKKLKKKVLAVVAKRHKFQLLKTFKQQMIRFQLNR